MEVRARIGTDQDLRFGLTERGRADALDALMRSGYVGPAPVPLADYTALVRKQSVHRCNVTRASMHEARFGPLSSNRHCSIQLGPRAQLRPCDFHLRIRRYRQDFIAKRPAAALLPGLVLVPHAVVVNETVIRVFDPQSTSKSPPSGASRGCCSAGDRIRATCSASAP